MAYNNREEKLPQLVPCVSIKHDDKMGGFFIVDYPFDKCAIKVAKNKAKELSLTLGNRVKFSMVQENRPGW